MSESREYWSFLIPWAGGLLAAGGDLSPLGFGWMFLVLIISKVIHSRVTKAPSEPHQEHRKANDA